MTATGRAERLAAPSAKKPAQRSSTMRPAVHPGLAYEREDDRRAARARRGAGVLHPAAGELVAERAQQQVGVGGGHDPGRMAPDVVLLHGFTHTGASWGPVVAALGESYRALAPDIRGHGSASDREPVALEAVLDDLAPGWRRRASSRWPATRWAGGSRSTSRSRCRRRVDRLVLIGASPGIADPAERDAAPAADERLAGEIEGSSIEQFAARWAQTPVLAGQPPRCRGGPRRPAAERSRRPGPGASRAGHGRAALAVGPARRDRDAGRARGRRARPEVPSRSPPRWRPG